jgi:elongator complex protein 1
VPFLNELRKLEENYQKFTIDKHLKKYESALLHLSKCDEAHAEECLNFIKTHKLYKEALKIFNKSHALYEVVNLI